MTDLWAQKHLPQYITEPFIFPDGNSQRQIKVFKCPEGIVPPPGAVPGKRYPVLIWCRGSETGAYEALISQLPEREIGIVFYRVLEEMERLDFPDKPLEREQKAHQELMKFVDTLGGSWIDPEWLYIGGTGFGAQLAAYALSENARFQRAILGPGVYDPATASGTGSIGPKPGGGESLLHFYETGVQHSVLTRIDTIKTPVLFMYDRADNRIGLEQVEEFYAAMKDRNPEIACRLITSPENGPDMSELSEAFLKEITNWIKEINHED